MSMNKRAAATIVGLAGLMLAGCAGEGGMDGIFTTGSIGSSAASEPRVDPACVTLSSRIEVLRKEGIADKIEKAAAKKYKMTAADLNKAAQLNRANAEFQTKCSTLTTTAAASPAATETATTQVATATPRTQAAVSSSDAFAGSGGQ